MLHRTRLATGPGGKGTSSGVGAHVGGPTASFSTGGSDLGTDGSGGQKLTRCRLWVRSGERGVDRIYPECHDVSMGYEGLLAGLARRGNGLGEDGGGSSCLGGMRLAWFNATWPLVRLVLMRNGIRLEPSLRFLKRVVPVWEVRYDELLEAQAVGNIPLFTVGIRLRTTGGWVVFWAMKAKVRERLLRRIAEQGVKVGLVPKRFHFLNPEG